MAVCLTKNITLLALVMTIHGVNASMKNTDAVDKILEDEECLICLHNVDAAELKKCYASCAAAYHQKCWDEWMKNKVVAKCPHCREYQSVSSFNRSMVSANRGILLNVRERWETRAILCCTICYVVLMGLSVVIFVYSIIANN